MAHTMQYEPYYGVPYSEARIIYQIADCVGEMADLRSKWSNAYIMRGKAKKAVEVKRAY